MMMEVTFETTSTKASYDEDPGPQEPQAAVT